MLEFLVAQIAILEVWSQVGGQNHLDLMPWYTKLSLTVGLALVTVAGTVSAVSHERAWNAKTIACLALGLMMAGAMGGVTLYYHLHEGDEAESSDEPTSISRRSRASHGKFSMTLGRTMRRTLDRTLDQTSGHIGAHGDVGEARA
jgi:hypothetical protein